MTPPSAMASRKMQANAGPEPDKAVQASKCFSSRKRQRPIDENMLRMMDRWSSDSSEGERLLTTVMPSRIWKRSQPSGRLDALRGRHTDLAGGIGHSTDDFCGREDHCPELRDGHTGQDAYQQLPL